MNWKDFKEYVEGVVPPQDVDMSEWEVIILAPSDRTREWGVTGIDYDEEEDPPVVIIEVKHQ